MSVEYDPKTKTWRARFRVKDPITGKTKQSSKRGFRTKREAKQYESDILKEPASNTGKTFADVAAEYLDWKNPDPKSEMRQKKQASYRLHFPYNDVPIKDITIQQMVSWQTDLQKEDFSTSLKNAVIQHVKAVFRFASSVYDIPDPSVMVKSLKKPIEEDREMSVWTVEEFNQFIACVDNLTFKLFFEMLFWSGMRRGECIALLKADLDGEWININKSMKHAKNGSKGPKNRASIRRIKLDPKLVEDLQPLLTTAGPYLFGGETSLAISSIDRHFHQGIKASGVKPIRLHDLRHSHATLLINSGCNIVAVSRRLGHSTVNETLATYTHLFRNTDDEMMDTITAKHK